MKKNSVAAFLSLAFVSSTALAKMSLETSFVPGEVFVKVRPGQIGKFLAQKSLLGAEVKKEIKTLSGQFVLLKSNFKSTQSLLSQLVHLKEVQYAEPNYLYKAFRPTETLESILFGKVNQNHNSTTPNDPLYEKLWGLKNTGSNEPDRNGGTSTTPGVVGADTDAEKGWTITTGSKKITIAVIDTGIDYTHPDLENQMWTNKNEIPSNDMDDDNNGFVDDVHGWNAFAKNGDPMDGNSHGTHCAGTIGAEHNNGIGVAGVMNNVALMAVKFLSDEGSGSLADAAQAIDYATKMNVDIMSNSWGGGGFSKALEELISTAKDKGIIFVAAAGNDSSNNDSGPSYPASYQLDNVISVASHTAQDTLSSFSNFGKRSVHVAAPGSNILSCVPGGNYKVKSGTSMATPHTSGVVGLLLSETGRLPVLEVRNRLMATTTPGSAYRKSTQAGGRVNIYNFLTDTRIPRQGPHEDAWRIETLSDFFETGHPYDNNTTSSKTYSFPGAKFVKLVIEKYDTEFGYDFVIFKDAKGQVIEKISGAGSNYESDYAESDSVTVEFSSDSSINRWGVVVKEVKVIY
jgi:thermitase